MVELGTLQNHAVTLNISYMQVHPGMDNEVLPLGVGLIEFMVFLGNEEIPKIRAISGDDGGETLLRQQDIPVQEAIQKIEELSLLKVYLYHIRHSHKLYRFIK